MKIVSVIIPCYNQSEFLNEALRSVYVQSHENWECLIIDDGSMDNTKFIAKGWCTLDTRFKYFYKENGGLSSARNFGISKSQGDFIQFLDSDDLIRDDKFTLQINDLRSHSISVSDYFPFNDITQKFVEHRYLSPFLDELSYMKELILDWENKKSIPCHAILFHRKLIEDNNLSFDEQLDNHEDWLFWVQLFYFSNNVFNRKDVLAFYRIHDKSMTVDFFKMRKGFLSAALKLNDFFIQYNSKNYSKLARKKYKLINKTGKSFIVLKLLKRTYRRIKAILNNV